MVTSLIPSSVTSSLNVALPEMLASVHPLMSAVAVSLEAWPGSDKQASTAAVNREKQTGLADFTGVIIISDSSF
jgi:hypothetical protein